MTTTLEITKQSANQATTSTELSDINPSLPSSVHAAHETVAKILANIVDRASREPFFRESLIADPELTINSMLNKLPSGGNTLPEFVSVKVVEDTDSVMNLVIPSPSNDFADAQRDPSTLLAILSEASTNAKLAAELTSDPRGTLERELSSRNNLEVKIDQSLEVKVTAAQPGQLVITLPAQTSPNVPWSATDEALYSKDSLSPIAGLTNVDSCRYTTDYCNTNFTNCGNGCGTSGCWTQTQECRRTH